MSKRIVVLLMLIPAAAMVACSGGEEVEPASSGQAAGGNGATVPAETPVPPTATQEPTATPAPPTPTLAPTPTEATGEAQPEEDQGEAIAGDDSSGSGSATAGSGWGASGSGAQSACDHPYLPIRTGSTWTYQGAEGPIIWEVIEVQGDMDQATAVLKVTVGDVTLDYQWLCTAGEGLSSFDFANLTAAPAGIDLAIEQVSLDGQFLLPAGQMVPGATWTAEMLGTISFSQEIEGTTIEATGDMKTVQQHTVKSGNPVDVNGQSVPGLQMEQVNNITMTLLLMGAATEQAFTINNSYELGYGIGIVNQSSVTDFGTESMSLVEYSIP